MSGLSSVLSNGGMVVSDDDGATMLYVRELALARSTKESRVARLSSNRGS